MESVPGAVGQLQGAVPGMGTLRLDLEQCLLAVLSECGVDSKLPKNGGLEEIAQGVTSKPGRPVLPTLVKLFPPPAACENRATSEENNDKSDVSEYASELRGCTTVMVQQLPHQCTQSQLEQELIDKGFGGLYDYLYMPVDSRNRYNRGFGFVNFTAAEYAEKFYDTFHGVQLFQDTEGDNKPLIVAPADVQGYAENVSRFYNLCRVRKIFRKRRSHAKSNVPILYGPGAGNDISYAGKHEALSATQRARTVHATHKIEIGQQPCSSCWNNAGSDYKFCSKCGKPFERLSF